MTELMMDKRCDLCGKTNADSYIDGKMRGGPWALMCLSCYQRHGVGLGTGLGQQYDRQTDGTYKKVKG